MSIPRTNAERLIPFEYASFLALAVSCGGSEIPADFDRLCGAMGLFAMRTLLTGARNSWQV